jgi:hypothetical protein
VVEASVVKALAVEALAVKALAVKALPSACALAGAVGRSSLARDACGGPTKAAVAVSRGASCQTSAMPNAITAPQATTAVSVSTAIRLTGIMFILFTRPMEI